LVKYQRQNRKRMTMTLLRTKGKKLIDWLCRLSSVWKTPGLWVRTKGKKLIDWLCRLSSVWKTPGLWGGRVIIYLMNICYKKCYELLFIKVCMLCL
jgi:hypothetical protein